MTDRLEPPFDEDYGVDERDDGPALPPFLLDPLGVLRRRWPWMLLAVLMGFAASAAVAYFSKPTYRAVSTMLISRQQIPEHLVRSTVREDTIANVNVMVGRVLSRANLERLIEQLDLFADRPADLGNLELVGELRGGIEVGLQQGSTSRRGDESSLIYGIEYSSTNPREAAEVANALAALFMEASIERRSLQARSTTEFLRRQLERDETELREQSRAVAAFRRENRGELPGELDTALRRLELLSERRHSLVTEIASKENRILMLAAQPTETQPSTNEILLDEVRRELARESAVHTDAHPNVVALKERAERLEAAVAKEQVSAVSSFLIAPERRELEILKRQLAETGTLIEQLNRRVDRTPAVGEELAVLEQKELVLRERYLSSLRKVEQAELAESLELAQQGTQVSLLDPAQEPTSPDWSRGILVAGGVALSLAFALALGVLLEFVDPVILSVAQLERLSDPPCLGALPLSA